MLAATYVSVLTVVSATPFHHGWDTVADVMSMHGKFDPRTVTLEHAIEGGKFAAQNYAQITTGTSCNDWVNITGGFSIESAVRAFATGVKKDFPGANIGMYWRTDFALELAECSDLTKEWIDHPEWKLKDDSGKVIPKNYIDYSQQAAADFFGKVLLSTLESGELNYVYLDGVGGLTTTRYPGVSPARATEIIQGKYDMISSVQSSLDSLGKGQRIILNGLDNNVTATEFIPTNASGAMFDHWSILQFLNRTNGDFNKSMMDDAFQLATSKPVLNFTLQIKGWPGPIVQQRDKYPPNLVTPTTPEEFQTIGAQRFNSELALFLLVADETDFWIYSWFWNFYDYIPGDPTSSVASDFYPQAKCRLGSPIGPYVRNEGTWTYSRFFEHANVFVDLTNRTASTVAFDTCDV